MGGASLLGYNSLHAGVDYHPAKELSIVLLLLVASLALTGCAGSSDEGETLAVQSVPDAGTLAADAAVFDAAALPDAAPARAPLPEASVSAECAPGTYQGKFDCNVNGLPIWGGAMVFTLESVAEGAGEFRALRVVAGTRLMGSDSYGGTIDAELVGDFDCDTGVLEGAIERGTYTGWWGSGISIQGPLVGNYQAGTPRALPGTWAR